MMGSNDVSMILLGILGGAVALGVAIALIVVSVKVTGGLLAAIGWLIKHLFRFVFGLIKDAVSLVGSIIASIVAVPFATFNVVLARWEAAGRWGGALKRETLNVGYRCYSIVLRRPLQLLCLDGLLEGVEKRLPQEDEVNASAASPFVPDPTVRRGPSEFDGYTIEGTLRPGGSGAKLYIARPDDEIRRRLNIACDRVVIKSFALEEGSSLPQIVRESRALDSARALGLVFDHGLDGGRFWYAMPYHPGESLAETTRFLHARSGSEGLHGDELREAIGFASDLVATLARYHDGGLWHKDVKPDNIIVHDGRAHLVDLGLVTPLRSAMTLTTHGTEYFRDPEMVRQALRGVRVHQVDGGKFDVYGAGAVIYFMLENTFPAHGGLSSFMKRSPEALRWIVRRSMAEYHQRYHSAKAMFEDLAAVAQAADPWSLKPVELPSMRSADLNAVGGFAPASVAGAVGMAGLGAGAGAAAAAPPAMGAVGAGFGAGMGHGIGWMGAGAAAIPVMAGRPRLAVTNWWSGSYASPDMAERVRGTRTEIAEAARAAREAVRANRRSRRQNRVATPRLPALFGFIVAMTFIALMTVMVRDHRKGTQVATPTESALSAAMAPARLAAPTAGTKLVLVNDHPAIANPEIATMVDRVVASYEKVGFVVVRDAQELAAKISLETAKQRAVTDGSDAAMSTEIEASLAAAGYFGAIHVRAGEGAGTAAERFRAMPLGEQFVKAIGDAKSSSKDRSKRRSTRTADAPARIDTAPSTSAPPTPIPVIEAPVPPIAPPAPAAPTQGEAGSSDGVTKGGVSATLSSLYFDSRRFACRVPISTARPHARHGCIPAAACVI
jgi:hypothetical protein